MTCRHSSIRRRVKGQQDICIQCELPIIFNGEKWVWEHELDPGKRRKLINIFLVNEMTRGT